MDKSDELMLAGMIQDVGANFLAAGTKKKDREFAEKQSDKAYDRSLQHWNQVNEYNKPSAQMNRFKDAGLNTNLIYGNMANTPASHSVDYPPARGDHSLPGPTTDHAKYLQANIQQQAVDQSVKYQSQIMEQTVRMNEYQIQRMAIQNSNMEADTLNKGADLQNKVLQHLANSLGIEYDYGKDIKGDSIMNAPGQRQWGMKDYDREAKELGNYSLQNRLILEIQSMSQKDAQIWWAKEKNRIMRKFGTNIDKDPSYERKIVKIIDELF